MIIEFAKLKISHHPIQNSLKTGVDPAYLPYYFLHHTLKPFEK